MIEFDVALTQDDLKSFILHKMKIKSFKFWVPIIMCFLLATLISIANLWLKFGLFVWFVVVTLLCMGFSPVFKAIKFFNAMMAKGLELVGKSRKFFIDERSIYILYKGQTDTYNRYFFYDLQDVAQTDNYLFLTFHRKNYIIVPKRFLKHDQLKKFLLILEKKFVLLIL